MIKNGARLVVALLCALLLAACREPARAEAHSFQGLVELDTVTLAFEVAGRIDELAVREGDHVQAGQRVAKLDDALAVPERAARAAELEAQRAQLALLEAGARREDVRAAAADLESLKQQEQVLARQRARQVQLTSSGAVPSSALDTFDSQVSALEGRRSVAEERLRVLRGGARAEELAAARASVRALESGLEALDARIARYALSYEGGADVLDVHVEVDEVVGAGTPVMTLADLSHPYVDVFVPQGALAGVVVGKRATVRVDSLAKSLPGRIERVGYKTEFTPRYLFSEKERANLVVRVRVRVDDPEHVLHAGVPAFVGFAPGGE